MAFLEESATQSTAALKEEHHKYRSIPHDFSLQLPTHDVPLHCKQV